MSSKFTVLGQQITHLVDHLAQIVPSNNEMFAVDANVLTELLDRIAIDRLETRESIEIVLDGLKDAQTELAALDKIAGVYHGYVCGKYFVEGVRDMRTDSIKEISPGDRMPTMDIFTAKLIWKLVYELYQTRRRQGSPAIRETLAQFDEVSPL